MISINGGCENDKVQQKIAEKGALFNIKMHNFLLLHMDFKLNNSTK